MRVDSVHSTVCCETRGEEGQFGTNRSGPSTHPGKTVLLADDNDNDIFLMKAACESSGIPHLLQLVTDGVMAIDYLSGRGVYADRAVYPMPDIAFLDINMPKVDGFEVLKLIRAKPGLKKLPVIMLSTSTMTRDVDHAYELGVTSYLIKSPNYKEFNQAVGLILKCWLELHPCSVAG